jgi:hypothetical protein
MKNLIFRLFVLMTFYCTFSNAQAPGYLGKKASIMFNFSSFPAIAGPTQNNRGNDDNTFGEGSGKVGLNYEFEGHFSYVTGRYVNFAVFVGQYFTGVTSNAETESIVPDPNDFYSNTDRHYLFNRLNVRSAGITYSKFSKRRGALAPIGNRFFMSLKRSFITSEIIDKRTEYGHYLGESFGHAKLNIDESMTLDFFHMGWSNTQVFWNKMLFNVGVKIGFPLNFKYYGTLSDGGRALDIYETNQNQAQYESAVFDRIFRHEFFRVDIGVGYLLF